jgi:hypothetical protein
MKNLTWAEWVVLPENIGKPIIAFQIGEGGSIPVKNQVCPLCNDARVTRKLRNMNAKKDPNFDAELNKEIRKGTVHGWSRIHGPVAIFENTMYHAKCLRKKFGNKAYDASQEIIEIGGGEKDALSKNP